MGMKPGGPPPPHEQARVKLTRPLGVIIKTLFSFTTGLKKTLLWAIIVGLIYAGTQILSPLILTSGLEYFQNIDDTTFTINYFGRDFPIPQIITIFIAQFAFFATLGFLLNGISIRLLSKANALMVDNIRVELYTRLIKSSMSYLNQEESGNITARITSDTDQISTGIQFIIIIATQLVLFVATFIVILVMTTWQVIVICLCAIPALSLLSIMISTVGRKIILKSRTSFGKVSGKMAESFAGAAVSKSFNQEEKLSTQLKILNNEYYKISRQFGLVMNFTIPIISTTASIVIAVILWVGGVISTMTIPDIFLGITLSFQFLNPIIMLSMAVPQLQAAFGAVDRVLDVMEAAPAIQDSPNAESLSDNYSVTFDSVWFAYKDDKYIIKDLSFKVVEGEMVALVGETGAGKTTIASMLLPRFYDIQKGEIKIGKQNIQNVTQHTLRQCIGLIPQNPYLFSATVLENIKYGKPDATEQEIYDICKLLGADAFIDALPNGYETMVVEGGKHLSAGQRQMITIARTMLADPKILVLDEATSRLDAYSESLVQNAQRTLFENRTTFVIAHRLSTIHDAQKILVLDHGKLVEEGSHEELMKQRGIYADLYNTYYSFQGLESLDLKDLIKDQKEEIEFSPVLPMKDS